MWQEWPHHESQSKLHATPPYVTNLAEIFNLEANDMFANGL